MVRWCKWQHTWFSARRREFKSPTDCHAAVAQHLAEHPSEAREAASSILAGGTNQFKAPFGYGLVSCSFTAGERVRVPHGVLAVR